MSSNETDQALYADVVTDTTKVDVCPMEVRRILGLTTNPRGGINAVLSGLSKKKIPPVIADTTKWTEDNVTPHNMTTATSTELPEVPATPTGTTERSKVSVTPATEGFGNTTQPPDTDPEDSLSPPVLSLSRDYNCRSSIKLPAHSALSNVHSDLSPAQQPTGSSGENRMHDPGGSREPSDLSTFETKQLTT